MNPCKSKQGIKDLYLPDLRRCACTWVCERTSSEYYIKGRFLKEERKSFCLGQTDVEAGLTSFA